MMIPSGTKITRKTRPPGPIRAGSAIAPSDASPATSWIRDALLRRYTCPRSATLPACPAPWARQPHSPDDAVADFLIWTVASTDHRQRLGEQIDGIVRFSLVQIGDVARSTRQEETAP